MKLLELADETYMQVSCGAVYSLHKSSTRAHIKRTADKELHATSSEVLAQLRFNLPATYAFHRCIPTHRCNASCDSRLSTVALLDMRCHRSECPVISRSGLCAVCFLRGFVM